MFNKLIPRPVQDEFEEEDFRWPDTVTPVELSNEQLKSYFSNPEHAGDNGVQLFYRHEDLSLMDP